MSNQAKRYSKDKQVKEQTINTWKDNRAQGNLNRFVPTQNQNKITQSIYENTITLLSAPAGTGKTSTVLHTYCKEYLKDNTLDILIIRTPVEAGLDSIGFLPDTKEAKLEPHFAAYRKILTDFLGQKFNADLGKRIHFDIPNFQISQTWDNKLVIIDESQQLPPLICKLLLERIGVNTKVVMCGDPTQLYQGGKRNGLTDAIERFINEDGTPKYKDVGYVYLDAEDVMRSDIVKTVIKAYS